jgi:hypothetical protein
MLRRALLRTTAAALSACPALSQQTIRVPQDQPTLEAAFSAAADGDRVLLAEGNHDVGASGLALGKSLIVETVGNTRATIHYPASTSAFIPAQPALTITGFGGGGRIVLRNLSFAGGYSPWAFSQPRSAVIDVQLGGATAGEVVLEGVEAVGETRHQHGGCPALRLASGPAVRVMLRHCRIEGATGQSPLFANGEVEYDGSTGALVDALGPFSAEKCRFVGGAGGRAAWSDFGPFMTARAGGAAALLHAPLGTVKDCDFVDGTGGAAYAGTMYPWTPDPCEHYGAPGTSAVSTDVFDCVRTFVPYGCNQTAHYVAMQLGRNDVEPIPPAAAGVSFRFKVRSLPVSSGVTFWLFGSGLDNILVPGIGGRLYVADAFVVGIVPPPPPYSWAEVWISAPPATLPWLSTFAVQPLHLDTWMNLQFGSVSTFTVLVP